MKLRELPNFVKLRKRPELRSNKHSDFVARPGQSYHLILEETPSHRILQCWVP